MSAALPSVVPILATPLGLAAIPDAERLNPALSATCSRGAPPPIARPAPNPLRFSSTDDLMDWPEPPARQLTQGIAGAVYSLVSSVSNLTEAQLRSLQI